MNDFVKVSKIITGNDADFSDCTPLSRGYDDSYIRYNLFKGYTPIVVQQNNNINSLTIAGNFGMFWNGHNIAFPYTDFRSSLCYVSEKLNVDLFKFNVDQFDQSAIVIVEDSPDTIISNHHKLPGAQMVTYDNGKTWKYPFGKASLYNATKRMKDMKYSKLIKQQIFERFGISDDQNLIRFENKYNKPGKTFNSKLTVENLLKPEFIEVCNRDLINTYISIMKTGIVNIPDNKKDINSATLPLIVLQELSAIYGFDTKELLRQRIKAIPPAILSNDDKKARQRQVNHNLKKIQSSTTSRYDISGFLEDSLLVR